jgi:hypothetical protein
LTFYPRPLGTTRTNAYPKPGLLDDLAGGLSIFGTGQCAGGDVAIPDEVDPQDLAPLVRDYVFRAPDGVVARPACKPQGSYPGFATNFPQLRAEP